MDFRIAAEVAQEEVSRTLTPAAFAGNDEGRDRLILRPMRVNEGRFTEDGGAALAGSVTASEPAGRFGISSGSVSGAIKMLSTCGLIECDRSSGHRGGGKAG